MQNEIESWLKSSDHDHKQGLQLLKQVCRNKYLVRALSLKESKYTRAKLFHELNKYNRKTDQPDPVGKTDPITNEKASTPAPEVEETEATSEPVIDLNNMTAEQTAAAVEKLEVALSKMHNKRGILSNSLRSFDVKDNEGRKRVLDQIEGLNDDMQQIRDKLAYHQKHGKLPPVADQRPGKPVKNIFDDIPDDPAAMNKMLLNERSNISKYKRKLKNDIDGKLREKNEKRLTESTAIVDEIQRRLNAV